MRKKAPGIFTALAALAAILLAAPSSLWAQGGYLDELIVHVKPDKVSQFEAVSRKIADANRHNNGDRWLAMVSVYGESNTYVFTSLRDSYADIDKAADMFMGAINKSMGKVAAQKLLNDFNDCVESSRAEFRVRRPDLSSKVPTDPDSLNKMVGQSRVLRVLALRVRPGHEEQFESMMKDINSHANENPNTQPVLVSQAIEGDRGSTYYVTFLRTALGDFDHDVALKDIMGEEGMDKLNKTIAEVAAGSDSAIYRFAPELSSPPDEIAQVSADFWTPKTTMASMAKPKMKSGDQMKPKEKAAQP
jgi:hypothetical protein